MPQSQQNPHPHPHTSTIESRVAGLSTETESNAEQVISGVAVGPGDITKGLSGDRKVWRADELERAADSLAGGDLTALHSETVVGEVTDAGYVPDRGVVYEARIDDDEMVMTPPQPRAIPKISTFPIRSKKGLKIRSKSTTRRSITRRRRSHSGN